MIERYATSKLFGVMFITGRKEWLTISDEKSQEIQVSTLFCKEIYTCFSKKRLNGNKTHSDYFWIIELQVLLFLFSNI